MCMCICVCVCVCESVLASYFVAPTPVTVQRIDWFKSPCMVKLWLKRPQIICLQHVCRWLKRPQALLP